MRKRMIIFIIFIIFSLPGCAGIAVGGVAAATFNADHPSKHINELVRKNVELLKEQEEAIKN